MIWSILLCGLVFAAAKGRELPTPEVLLDEISSTVVTDMINTLDSNDVMTIDAALRGATTRVQPQLEELAKLKGVTTHKAARIVSNQVAQDKRLLEALSKRQGYNGNVSPRSSRTFTQYISSLVYSALTNPLLQ